MIIAARVRPVKPVPRENFERLAAVRASVAVSGKDGEMLAIYEDQETDIAVVLSRMESISARRT